jgi:hypothetical protein
MRVFCGTLLADLSVPDLLAELTEDDGPGAALDAETLTRRLEELVRWGNLLRSTHTVKATSITEYQRSRSRYQLSKLGERVQRGANEVLAGADAAREVSSELLVLVDRGPRAPRRRPRFRRATYIRAQTSCRWASPCTRRRRSICRWRVSGDEAGRAADSLTALSSGGSPGTQPVVSTERSDGRIARSHVGA